MGALCYNDPYKKEFNAKINKIETNDSETLILLDKTYFFYGSGGQSHDIGEIIGSDGILKVNEVIERDNEIWHKGKIKGDIREGEEVKCRIDWERRYKFMKAHTAEHLLFQCLKRKLGKIYVEKIRISPEKFSFFILLNNIDWEKILEAEKLANEVIKEGRDVLIKEISIEEAKKYGDNLRIKFDRIETEKVRVVEIKDFDLAACTGLHVRNTNEIGFLLINKITAEKGFYEVEFLVDEEARERAIELSKIALSLSSILQTDFSTIERYAEKLRKEYFEIYKKLQESNKKLLENIQPIEVNGLKIYKNVFENFDSKALIEKTGKLIKQDKSVVIFVNLNEKASLILARSNDINFNARELLNEALKIMNGKGGGKDNFATGAGDKDKINEVIDFLDKSIKRFLNKVDVE